MPPVFRREAHPMWRGGRHITRGGYVRVLVGIGHRLADSKGYTFEHVMVAEQKLGRYLAPGEVVHHIDGNKTNNDHANLEVFPSQADHVRHEFAVNPRMRRWKVGERPLKQWCIRGHEYTPDNTYIRHEAGKKPSRACRACHREYERERKQRRKVAA